MRSSTCSPKRSAVAGRVVAWLAAFGLAAWWGRGPAARAQTPDAGITVTGWGQATARPQVLELHVKVSGNGQLGTDALARFQQYRKELAEMVAAFAPRRVEMHAGGLAITPGGDPNAYWQTLAPGGQPAVGEIAISSVCRITINGISELSEQEVVELASSLMDKLRDIGLAILPAQQALALEAGAANDVYAAPALVSFVVEDLGGVQSKARRAAFQNAKASAEALAELAGMQLGPVIAVQEIGGGVDPGTLLPPQNAEIQEDILVQTPEDTPEGAPVRLLSRTSGPVPVRVGLHVRFALLPPADEGPDAQRAAAPGQRAREASGAVDRGLSRRSEGSGPGDRGAAALGGSAATGPADRAGNAADDSRGDETP
jgi:uncharacterized protein YggE